MMPLSNWKTYTRLWLHVEFIFASRPIILFGSHDVYKYFSKHFGEVATGFHLKE